MQDSLTADEALELTTYIDDPSQEALLRKSVGDAWRSFPKNQENDALEVEGIIANLEENVFQQIDGLEDKKIKKRRTVPLYWRYAAAIAVFFCAVGILIYTFRNDLGVSSIDSQKADIGPGTHKASLLLANGKTIVLSEKMEGIRVEGNLISYDNGEMLVDQTSPQDLLMKVPRGGKYKLQLSDGTKVWLNATTSLKYPSVFQGTKRIVEVEGEAYFEVHHDSTRPFLVKCGTQTVTVLGTSFNINNYQREEAITTLVDGRIALRATSGAEKILLPGDQAVMNGNSFNLHKVNTQDYIAWKDDLIVLNDQKFQDIFSQLERWYDVEFIGADLVNERRTLSGEIPRNTNLSTILQALEEQLHVKFEIKGRRIMIKN